MMKVFDLQLNGNYGAELNDLFLPKMLRTFRGNSAVASYSSRPVRASTSSRKAPGE
jgi:hypothetical protein